MKRVAFWKVAGLDYERDLSVQKGEGKIIIPGWVTKLVVLRHLCTHLLGAGDCFNFLAARNCHYDIGRRPPFSCESTRVWKRRL